MLLSATFSRRVYLCALRAPEIGRVQATPSGTGSNQREWNYSLSLIVKNVKNLRERNGLGLSIGLKSPSVGDDCCRIVAGLQGLPRRWVVERDLPDKGD